MGENHEFEVQISTEAKTLGDFLYLEAVQDL